MKNSKSFNENVLIEKLIHFLPAQAPLKDFITQNRLVSFQNETFHEAMKNTSEIFGYKVYLSLKEYRELYAKNKINIKVLESIIETKKGTESSEYWLNKLLNQKDLEIKNKRIGQLRSKWKSEYKVGD
jgi:hypothetical protein